ncbi:MAG: FecR family protein, partial [Spirochaetota bacterium]
MKRIITVGIISVIILISGFIAYLLITDYILIRYPVLVQTNPKITFIIGDAYFREDPKAQWKVAVVGQTLYKGYEIKTDPDSRMDIRLHDNTAIQLSGNSEMSIDALTVRKLSLNVHAGSLYGKFDKLFKEHDLQVKTPTAFAAIRGTDLGFEVIQTQAEDETKVGKKKTINKKIKKIQRGESQEAETTTQTVVYSLSGITEVYNPLFDDQKVLLSYRNKVLIDKDKMPNNPEELTEDEIRSLQEKLNS